MSYVNKHLIAGETVVYTTRLHWIVLIWSVVLAVIFGASGIALLIRYATDAHARNESSTPMLAAGLILLVVAVITIGVGITKKNATEMAVTNKRVVLKVGFVTRSSFELLLQKVESIGVKETVMGRILGYGTVVVDGTGGSSEPFDWVAHPFEFRKQVQEQIEKLLEKSQPS